jgi:hypothetical protein
MGAEGVRSRDNTLGIMGLVGKVTVKSNNLRKVPENNAFCKKSLLLIPAILCRSFTKRPKSAKKEFNICSI